MNYEFLRAIGESALSASDLNMDEATFKEYKSEYDKMRKEGASRTDALKSSIVVNNYHDTLRERRAFIDREKKRKAEAKKAKKSRNESGDGSEEFDIFTEEAGGEFIDLMFGS